MVGDNPAYDTAHKQAEVIDPRHQNTYTPFEKKGNEQHIRNNTTGKSKLLFKL